MARIAPVNAKGTRDYLPRDLIRRNRVFSLLRETFEHHGYEPLETPAVETTAVLEGKYGEEGDRLLFRVLKRGESLQRAVRSLATENGPDVYSVASLSRTLSDEALRYDLTVPFARVVAAHQNELVLPFRRYQIQPVWRADRPQRGRYREFYQCDVDCVGSRSLTVDAEMIAIHFEVFSKLGFTNFITHVNHRGLLSSLMTACEVPEPQRVATLTAMDKLDKIGRSGVRAELSRLDLDQRSVDRLMEVTDLTGSPPDMLDALRPRFSDLPEGEQALEDLSQVFQYAALMGVPPAHLSFDLSLVRGLGYYTGTIYETVLTGSGLGSLGAGGRYDRLIGQFTGRDLPCVGISFGLERIFDAQKELGLLHDQETTITEVLVTLFSPETLAPAFALAHRLRSAGIRTEISTEPKDLGSQLGFASKKGIPVAVILGPDEIASGKVLLRDLVGRTERAVDLQEAVGTTLAILASAASVDHQSPSQSES
jgi:histidyl-tRNA synthetase